MERDKVKLPVVSSTLAACVALQAQWKFIADCAELLGDAGQWPIQPSQIKLTRWSMSPATGQVWALISGGGLALVPAPRVPLTLDDKRTVSGLLLLSDLDIEAMNLARQQLFNLNSGGFLLHLAPAMVTALIMSDVVETTLPPLPANPQPRRRTGTAAPARPVGPRRGKRPNPS